MKFKRKLREPGIYYHARLQKFQVILRDSLGHRRSFGTVRDRVDAFVLRNDSLNKIYGLGALARFFNAFKETTHDRHNLDLDQTPTSFELPVSKPPQAPESLDSFLTPPKD